MAPELLVATRKGLFIMQEQNGRWQTVQTAFLAEPVTMVLPDRRSGRLYAGLNLGHFGVKLHRSEDRGVSWTECAAPAFPASEDPKAPAVKQIWALEEGGKSETGRLWAGTLPGGLFTSADGGDSWTLVDSLWDRPEREKWFGGGYDVPGIHSICVDPRDNRHLTVGVSCGGVWTSFDSGKNWECRAEGMWAEYMPPDQQRDPVIQDPHRVVQCGADPDALWAQHHNGIFRSTDGARSWQEVTSPAVSRFGFAVAVHPAHPEQAWFIPAVKDECRIPVEGKLVVTRTRDGGKTFDVLSRGLPQETAYDLVYRHGLDVDASGERLAFGSTTGSLWTSADQGDSWQSVSHHLPPVYCVRFSG